MIVSPLSLAAAEEDLAESVAKGCEAQIQEVAAAVSNTLIPALKGFISGISRASGLFSVMEHEELKKFEGKAEKSIDDGKNMYYKVMKAQATIRRPFGEASTRLYQKLGPISKPSHPREQTRTTSTGGWKSRRKPFKKNILFES